MRPDKYPKPNDIVMVNPIKITELGVYVQLCEYNNIEGLIILSDLCRGKFKNIGKLVTIGKKFPASVVSVDENTGNITLSKKFVLEQEIISCESRYREYRIINDIIILLAKFLEKECSQKIEPYALYQQFIWCLSINDHDIFNYLRKASKNFDVIYEDKLTGMNPKWIDIFKKILVNKFKDKDVVLEAVIEITCNNDNGAEIIRSTLINTELMSTIDFPFKVKIVKPPYYSITLKTKFPDKFIDQINTLVGNVQKNIDQNGGSLKIIKSPEITEKEFEVEDDSSNDQDD